jgi:hypothetical protein
MTGTSAVLINFNASCTDTAQRPHQNKTPAAVWFTARNHHAAIGNGLLPEHLQNF